jgi:hypothetical protein
MNFIEKNTIVSACYSKRLGFIATGGAEGKI